MQTLIPCRTPKKNLRAPIPSDRTICVLARDAASERRLTAVIGQPGASGIIPTNTCGVDTRSVGRRVASAIRRMLIFGKVGHPRRSNRAATSPFHSVSVPADLRSNGTPPNPAGSNNCPTFRPLGDKLTRKNAYLAPSRAPFARFIRVCARKFSAYR